MGALLDSLPDVEEVSPLAHVVAKFASGALAGLPEAAARRFGMGDVFEAGGATGVAGTVADLAGFAVGTPAKAIGLALKGTKAVSTLGRAVEQGARLGGFGAAYAGAQALVGGEDVGKRVMEEAPVWAAFGAGGPLLTGVFRKVFPKVDKVLEATIGLGEEVPTVQAAPQVVHRAFTSAQLPVRGRVAAKPVIDLYDSFGRKVEKPGFMLTAEELLAKRRTGEPVSILYDGQGRAFGASATAEIKLWEPDFKPRSTRTQAKLIQHRMNEVEEFRARMFPTRPLGAKLARAKLSGKADEVSAVAGEIRHTQETKAVVDAAKAAGRLPGRIQLSKINPSQSYEITMMSAEELPITMTVKGTALKTVLSDPQARIVDLVPKAEPAGFADADLLGEGYKNLGLPAGYTKGEAKALGEFSKAEGGYIETSMLKFAPVSKGDFTPAIKLVKSGRVLTGVTHAHAILDETKFKGGKVSVPEWISGYVDRKGKFFSQKDIENFTKLKAGK